MRTILAISTLLIAFPAMAVDNVYKPYVGLDYMYSETSAKFLDSYLNSGKVAVGSEYNKYFGTEVFYQKSLTKAQETSAGKVKSSMQAYGLDMYAYLPLGCSQKFSPYATTGLGKYALKQKIGEVKHNDRDGTGYRFGLGFRYDVDNHLSALVGYRYVFTDRLSTVDHINEMTAGLRYTF